MGCPAWGAGARQCQFLGGVVSAVIRFIESIGQNSSARHMTASDYDAAIRALGIGEEQAVALRGMDSAAISGVLGGRSKMMCMIWAPDQQPSKEDDQPLEGDVPEEDNPAEE
jgi:hypothetical protein